MGGNTESCHCRLQPHKGIQLSQSRYTRTLKTVIDVDTMKTISAENLMAASPTEYNFIRRAATRSWQRGDPRFVCVRCGHPVYAPLLFKRPYWKHFAGAPSNCRWWTGRTQSPEAVSARQFLGNQESALHLRIKNIIAELLGLDPETDDIVVDRFIVADGGRRRPDVRARYGGKGVAFEIQLATTQLPIILAREEFYERHGVHLIWVTWNFEPGNFEDIPQSIKDIYTGHNENIFSLDIETINQSRREATLVIRAHHLGSQGWISRLVTLDQLTWPIEALPYAIAPVEDWSEKFKKKWISNHAAGRMTWQTECEFLATLINCLQLPCTPSDLQSCDLTSLINCLLSLETGHPIGSAQSNILEVLNTFLYAKRRHQYAKILQFAAQRTGHSNLLSAKSVVDKLEVALAAKQVERSTYAARIVRALFPNWLSQ